MTAHLLDVNLLVALAWPDHVLHPAAQRWFAGRARGGWATTSVTEAGFLRVSSNPKVASTEVSWSAALELLALPSVTNALVVGHRQVTDVHLAAIAARHGGRLATLDRGVAEALHPDDRALVTLVPVT